MLGIIENLFGLCFYLFMFLYVREPLKKYVVTIMDKPMIILTETI